MFPITVSYKITKKLLLATKLQKKYKGSRVHEVKYFYPVCSSVFSQYFSVCYFFWLLQ